MPILTFHVKGRPVKRWASNWLPAYKYAPSRNGPYLAVNPDGTQIVRHYHNGTWYIDESHTVASMYMNSSDQRDNRYMFCTLLDKFTA